jgi:50S ribosomal protein L16 3-hydroxylase
MLNVRQHTTGMRADIESSPMNEPMLGGISVRQFLRAYWQKKFHFVSGAIADIEHMLDPREIVDLACKDGIESRLITRSRGRWEVTHGPFRASALKRLPQRDWTLLVQGVDSQLAAARELMMRFRFIPYARQDDLMVSIAPPGGGVGPHFDSYDVFLIQARGTRRWRFGTQRDLRLKRDTPLKILERFTPRHERVVHPGDLLYLPPNFAHDGVAETECMTCSIGFRAPEAAELTMALLQWLEDDLETKGRYADPELGSQAHPAEISGAMVKQLTRLARPIDSWRARLDRFLGCYLTEPKPNIWFSARTRPLRYSTFVSRAHRSGIRLDLKTRMLFRGRLVFMNGEMTDVGAADLAAFVALADHRELVPLPRVGEPTRRVFYQWYVNGYVNLG